ECFLHRVLDRWLVDRLQATSTKDLMPVHHHPPHVTTAHLLQYVKGEASGIWPERLPATLKCEANQVRACTRPHDTNLPIEQHGTGATAVDHPEDAPWLERQVVTRAKVQPPRQSCIAQEIVIVVERGRVLAQCHVHTAFA